MTLTYSGTDKCIEILPYKKNNEYVVMDFELVILRKKRGRENGKI